MNVPRLPDAVARASRDDDAARYQVDLNRYLAELAQAAVPITSGVWTPALVTDGTQPTVTYTASNRGRWCRVGGMVQIVGTLDVASFSGGTGSAVIGGLPFLCSADGGGRGGFSMTWATGFASMAAPSSAIPSVNTALAPLFRRASADARDALTTAVLLSECSTPQLFFHGLYVAA